MGRGWKVAPRRIKGHPPHPGSVEGWELRRTSASTTPFQSVSPSAPANCAKSQQPSTQRGSSKVVAPRGATYVTPMALAFALAPALLPAAAAPDFVPLPSMGPGLRSFFAAAGALGAADVSASMRVVARGARSVTRELLARSDCIGRVVLGCELSFGERSKK